MSVSVVISRGLHGGPIPDLPAAGSSGGKLCVSSSAWAFYLGDRSPIGLAVHLRGRFRQILGVSIIPPYDTYVLYDVYISPGLVAMIQLFNGMQSSLSMVYDREMGNMRMLLVSPFPAGFCCSESCWPARRYPCYRYIAYLLIAWLWGSQAMGQCRGHSRADP